MPSMTWIVNYIQTNPIPILITFLAALVTLITFAWSIFGKIISIPEHGKDAGAEHYLLRLKVKISLWLICFTLINISIFIAIFVTVNKEDITVQKRVELSYGDIRVFKVSQGNRVEVTNQDGLIVSDIRSIAKEQMFKLFPNLQINKINTKLPIIELSIDFTYKLQFLSAYSYYTAETTLNCYDSKGALRGTFYVRTKQEAMKYNSTIWKTMSELTEKLEEWPYLQKYAADEIAD